jgi:hypothetical protein
MNRNLKKCTLAILLVCTMTLLIRPSMDISAYSPSFPIQQFSYSGNWSISDPGSVGIGNSTVGKKIDQSEYLTQQNFWPRLRIIGESYSSDGKTLNGTLWLNLVPPNPSLNNDNLTIDEININKIHQEEIPPDISVNNGNFTFYNVTNPYPGKTASNLETTRANFTSGNGTLMIVNKNPIFYIITFNDPHKDLLPAHTLVKKTLDSFELLPADASKNVHVYVNVTSDHHWHWTSVRYPTLANRTKIDAPTGWMDYSWPTPDHWRRVYTSDPSWHSLSFEMTIIVLASPSYDTGHADYTVTLEWNKDTNHWTQNLYQIFQRGSEYERRILETKVVHPDPDFSNDNHGTSHVDIPLNLSGIGYPKNYVVASSVILDFYHKNVTNFDGYPYCEVKEDSPWVPLPPPKISLHTNPTSLSLHPGDATTIEVYANSSTAIPSNVSLSANSTAFALQGPSPRSIFLSSSSPVGTSNLHINVPQDILDHGTEFPLQINGNVTFPIGTLNALTGAHAPRSNVSALPISTDMDITVKPYTFSDFVSNVISPLTALWTFLAAVSAVIGPMVIRTYRKKK